MKTLCATSSLRRFGVYRPHFWLCQYAAGRQGSFVILQKLFKYLTLMLNMAAVNVSWAESPICACVGFCKSTEKYDLSKKVRMQCMQCWGSYT